MRYNTEAIAAKIVEFLCEQKVGYTNTISALIRDIGEADPRFVHARDGFFIQERVCKLISHFGLKLDYSLHKNMTIGLPQNMTFVLRDLVAEKT